MTSLPAYFVVGTRLGGRAIGELQLGHARSLGRSSSLGSETVNFASQLAQSPRPLRRSRDRMS
jgi:hypothetical protein